VALITVLITSVETHVTETSDQATDDEMSNFKLGVREPVDDMLLYVYSLH